MLSLIIGAMIVIAAILAARLFMILPKRNNNKFKGSKLSSLASSPSTPSSKIVKTLIVLGSGGHTAEMTPLVNSLDHGKYQFEYVIAATDKKSRDYAHANIKGSEQCKFYEIPRSREVGQSYITSIFTTLYSFYKSIHMVCVSSLPDLVLVNGPGTCIPVCMAAYIARVSVHIYLIITLPLHVNYIMTNTTKNNFFILQFIGLKFIKVVYVESVCRVHTLSLAGKILYRFADRILVQWPQVQAKYPHCEYIGRLF